MDIRMGSVVYGNEQSDEYKVIQPLGNGYFGIVYLIENKAGDKFALKTLITARLDEEKIRILLNEGKLASDIEHENVNKVIFFHDGTQYPELPPYLIMEYANGGNLQELLERQSKSGTFFSIEELREMFLQLANGMKAINAKLVHRDIKPDNILISDNKLKISDFGLSKFADAITRSQSFKGRNAVMYCAPEAWRQEKNTLAMDMYSMGLVFYELATLQYPYQVSNSFWPNINWQEVHLHSTFKNPKDFNSQLDDPLIQVVTIMLSKKPEDRYQNWDEVINSISTLENREEVDADVIALLEVAERLHLDRQKAFSEFELQKLRRETLVKKVNFHFETYIEGIKTFINKFNSQNIRIKLKINKGDSIGYFLFREDQPNSDSYLFFNAEPVFNPLLFKGQYILAYGDIKLNAVPRNDKGITLLLLFNSPEDEYGTWYAVYQNLIREVEDRTITFGPLEVNLQDLILERIGNLESQIGSELKIEQWKNSCLNLLIASLL